MTIIMTITKIEIFYDKIADEFDKTRVSLWRCVISFLNEFKNGSMVLDIGCGNGKYMNYRNDIIMKGIDISINLVEICKKKGFDVTKAAMTDIPYPDNCFDGFISIASYHHLTNDEDRKRTLDEMHRILKIGGIGLIEVWAQEQPNNINKNASNFKRKSNLVKWTSIKTGEIYYRYYNIYSNGDIENEIMRLKPEFKIIESGYEKGNYYIKIMK
jgi:ubiquinone/menaquinone biosynthesis C-methylase UbiE